MRMYRIGKPDSTNNTRPLKIVMNSASEVLNAFKSFADMDIIKSPLLSNVKISRDITVMYLFLPFILSAILLEELERGTCSQQRQNGVEQYLTIIKYISGIPEIKNLGILKTYRGQHHRF